MKIRKIYVASPTPNFVIEYGQGMRDQHGNIMAGLNTHKINGKVVTQQEFELRLAEYQETAMTKDQETVLIIKGTIADMPEADRKKVMEAYYELQNMIQENPLSALAMALIGAEIVAAS